MKPINITVPWLPEWIDRRNALAVHRLPPGLRGQYPPPAARVLQAVQWGVVPWYLAYVILLPFYWKRPREHPMEVRAYAAMWQEEEKV